eukprot:GEMP01051530.1.p1 GENE.GEMP01051530.1~~GEMP01051530.1.p1  ORF type:complete len:194 (+),score=25.10 GEMP01051530.1:42-584(+)
MNSINININRICDANYKYKNQIPAMRDSRNDLGSDDRKSSDSDTGPQIYTPYCSIHEYSDLVPWNANTACPTCRQELPTDSIRTLLISSLLEFERKDYPFNYRAHQCYHAAEIGENGGRECGYLPCARGDVVYVIDEQPTAGKPSHSCPAGYLFGYNAKNMRLGWVPIDVLTPEALRALR